MDLAHDNIIVRDRDDRITYWNRGAEECYGWTRQEALGQETHTLFKTRFPVPLDEFRELLKQQGNWSGELVHTKRDGKPGRPVSPSMR